MDKLMDLLECLGVYCYAIAPLSPTLGCRIRQAKVCARGTAGTGFNAGCSGDRRG